MLFPFAGYDKAAKAVYLRDIWPRRDEIAVGCSAINSSQIHSGFLNDWKLKYADNKCTYMYIWFNDWCYCLLFPGIGKESRFTCNVQRSLLQDSGELKVIPDKLDLTWNAHIILTAEWIQRIVLFLGLSGVAAMFVWKEFVAFKLAPTEGLYLVWKEFCEVSPFFRLHMQMYPPSAQS